jgi:putative ABC transport system substrate-binding protein
MLLARHTNRRAFITLLGGAAAWPVAAGAQQSPVIGFINPASPAELAYRVAAFRTGLGEVGFVEGRNVAIEYRWAQGRYEELPALASDLVKRGVAVIAATGGIASVQAARSATADIPIVFTTGSDPVEAGLVTSLNRPGGNVTGAGLMSTKLVAKRMELLRELIPNAKSIAILANAGSPSAQFEIDEAESTARLLGLQIHIERASGEQDFARAFASIAQARAGGLLVATDPFFESVRGTLVALAAQHAIPTIYSLREYADAGGLISYGASITDLYRQAGSISGESSRARSRRICRSPSPANSNASST